MVLDTARVATDTVDAHLSDHNTLHTKANNLPDVVADYGADNTGATDASSEIQEAYDDLTGGGELIIPAGVYKLSSGLTFATGTDISDRAVTVRAYGAEFRPEEGVTALTLTT